MTELMNDSVLAREGWINSEAVLRQLDRAAKAGWAPNQLWYVLVLELWLRQERGDVSGRASSAAIWSSCSESDFTFASKVGD